MRNPLPDMIITLMVLTVIFVAVNSYRSSYNNNSDYYDYPRTSLFENVG